jgi:4-amino-4-deoxy-L-arabinose transferase-like glycosyltransferase
MSRRGALLLVVAVWAAIYLPSLGLFEIKGEEGRRILPGMAMLETGKYLIPQVGGEDYFRKPPLINWLVAGSFKIFGARNEWTARAPSVLCLLVVAVAFVTVARRSLGPAGSTIAALVWLTNVGIVQKGRLIEIEALYVSLCALALICWLSWWREQRSPWLTWVVPWIFLGLGCLAKGPTHLFFFYAVVFAVLWQTKQWRALFHPAHFLGLLLMAGIFAAWAIPFLHASESGKAVSKWSSQFTGRVTGEIFNFVVWITCIPRAIAYFLPWLLLLPFVRFGKIEDDRDRSIARGLLWGAGVPLILVSLMPGSAPRYSLPAMAPFCWLMGIVFSQNALAGKGWLFQPNESPSGWWPAGLRRVGLFFVVLALAAGLIGYPVWALRYSTSRQKVKNIADKINAAVPASETLYAIDPNYQPFFFYMHSPVKYLSSLEELPWETHYFLVRPVNEKTALTLQKWTPRQVHSVLRVKDYRNQTVIVFMVDPA